MINNIEDIFELTPCQEGILFHSEFDKQENLYVVQSVIDFTGDLNVNKLKQCIDEIIGKNQAFRTEIVWKGLEKPYQVVHNRLSLPWYYNDLSQNSDSKLNELRDFDKRQVSSTFPLFRFRLIKITKDLYKLIFTRHHLIMDGWSHSVFLEDLRKRYIEYNKLEENEESIKFSDYVTWLNEKDNSAIELFWKSNLNKKSNITSPNFFPNEKNKRTKDEPFSSKSIVIPENLTNELLNLGKKYHFTMNSLFQSVWALLLSRYNSEEEIIYGSTFSGRPTDLLGSSHSYGAYINTIPLKFIVKDSMIFSDWILDNQKTLSQFEKNQFCSILKIREWAGIQNDKSLFDILFVYEKFPSSIEEKDWGSISLKKVETSEKNNYPITVVVKEEKELTLTIKYNNAYISSEYSNQIMDHFFNILNNIKYYLSEKISNINILTRKEQCNILEMSSGEIVQIPNDVYIHDLFENQVKKTPTKIAVVDSKIEFTYEKLNELSNQFANYLKRKGVKSNTLVGVIMVKSVHLLICLLGILKTGAAYIPIDPSTPPKRMDHIITNSKLKWLVCDNSTYSICENHLIKIINILQSPYIEESKVIERCKLNPIDTAYIIYTSGTTGEPKGVEISHRGFMNYLKWGINYYMNKEGVGSIVHSSIGFDLTITSLYLPILTGKTVFMSNDNYGIEGLIKILKQYPNQSFIKITPSHFKLLSNIPNNEISVKTFIIGGEQLNYNHISGWVDKKINLINEYGPTETVVGSTFYKIGNTKYEENVPIGKPIFNTQIYILDSNLRMVPKGVTGEIYIGGFGVAKGYINNLDLTNQKFINNPFNNSEKIYKTGDMGRILVDGNIEFVGRVDNQIKINGYRIEIGEVEGTMNRHPSITQSKVILESKNAKVKRGLIAFITVNNNIDANEIMLWLQDYLPSYMIPLGIFTIDKFPVNNNGKIDNDELYNIMNNHKQNLKDSSESKTDMEKFIENIWCDIINVDSIESNDNFFLIGGHSIYAMRMISEINNLFNFELSISSIFKFPTLKLFSFIVEEKLLESEEYKGENNNDE
ncbi:non-ribosomal peptide synthetase [Oceanobacillus kimchii]|uniref:non-ribosomal peptide synthetase n=1 Tax=Oceanobacillus kimchii TaxID=746691 RepID=UPI003B023DCF